MQSQSSKHAMHLLRKEIDCLTEKQTDDLETATFIGLTADETRAHEARRDRILDLVRQLRSLESAA